MTREPLLLTALIVAPTNLQRLHALLGTRDMRNSHTRCHGDEKFIYHFYFLLFRLSFSLEMRRHVRRFLISRHPML